MRPVHGWTLIRRDTQFDSEDLFFFSGKNKGLDRSNELRKQNGRYLTSFLVQCGSHSQCIPFL